MVSPGGGRWLSRAILLAFCWITVLFMVAPALIVIPLSFTDKPSFVFPPTGWSIKWYRNFFTDPSWLGSVSASLRIGLLVAVVAVAIGTPAAIALWRHRFRGRELVRYALIAPIIMPAMVTAIGIYAIFLRLHLVGTIVGFVCAHSVLALPFVVITISASLEGLDKRLLDASASCGANAVTTFVRILAPLILPGLMSGALFAFVTSFDEIVFALFIQGPGLETLPVKMYTSVLQEIDPTIAAAATLILTLTMTLVVSGIVVVMGRRTSGDE